MIKLTNQNYLGWRANIDPIIFLISVLIIIGLPVILIGQILDYQDDKTVLTSVDLVKSLNVTYPNITICHPRFFDVEKLQGL